MNRDFYQRYGASILIAMLVLASLAVPAALKFQREELREIAIKQLQLDFPSAITRQAARVGGCTYQSLTKNDLLNRGLSEETVWGTAWGVEYTYQEVDVTYPVAGSSNPGEEVKLLAAALDGSEKVLDTKQFDDKIVVTYACRSPSSVD